MARVTIRDVARVAGVGIGTVSRVINNNPNVSDHTRQLIWDTIEELGFVPNAAARQLPRKTPLRSVGVITPTFESYYSFSERLRGVQKALIPYNEQFDLSLYTVPDMRDYEDRFTAIIETSVISGLLVIDFDLTKAKKETLKQHGVPFVGLNHIQDASDWVCFGHHNEDGGYLATQHLLDLGHTRIAYIGNELIDGRGFPTSKERYTGYLRALHDAGVPRQDQYFKTSELNFASAKQMTLDLLRLPQRPTAIVSMSDIHALGSLEAARELGLRVPEDLSVMGYDDLEMSSYVGLSTVCQHLELGGEVAMNYLLEMIHHSASDDVPALPALEVIQRRTTARL
ncbi:MAG: LacI family DNA-binding transcriptional regulator [Chloroflexota bacterium]